MDAVVSTRHEMLPEFYRSVSPALVCRFKVLSVCLYVFGLSPPTSDISWCFYLLNEMRPRLLTVILLSST